MLRLRPGMFPHSEDREALTALLEWAGNADADWRPNDIRSALKEASIYSGITPSLKMCLEALGDPARGLVVTRYPDSKGVCLQNRRAGAGIVIDSLDDEEDSLSTGDGNRGVSLIDHTRHVTDEARVVVEALPLALFREALLIAARIHDWGKADPRFQALLARGDAAAASAMRELMAKSPHLPRSARERKLARKRSGVPDGFRHEMLSLQLADNDAARTLMPAEPQLRALVLHLIASHHGYARPFAPVVTDDDPPPVEIPPEGSVSIAISLSLDERIACPPHRIDSGVAERFWMLTRMHGWWGLAYLEAALRLADQQASERESRSGRN